MKFDKVKIEHVTLTLQDFKEKGLLYGFKASTYFDYLVKYYDMKRILITLFISLFINACKSVPSNLDSNKEWLVLQDCENKLSNSQGNCFQDYIALYIRTNFNPNYRNDIDKLNGEIEQLIIRFNVDKKGYISSIKAYPKYKNWELPHPSSLLEAERVLKVLTKEIRLNLAVTPLNEVYEIPINLHFSDARPQAQCEPIIPPPPSFTIERSLMKDSLNIVELKDVWIYFGENIHLNNVDTFPTMSWCDGIINKENTRACFSSFFQEFLKLNFDYELMSHSNLKGILKDRVWFLIDKYGNVGEVCTEGDIPILSNEVIRVVKSLPKMNPATYNSRKVGAVINYPISIELID